jgi:hypothetical protein
MYVRLVRVVGLGSGEKHLEAEAPGRHRRYRDRHRVKKFAVVLHVILGVLTANPALEMGDVTLKIRHYRP